MSDEKVITGTATVPAVPVTMIGTGDGLTRSVLAKTPADQPDVTVRLLSPLLGISVRVLNTFLKTLASLVGAGMTTNIIPASDFWHLLLKCAALSVAAAGVELLKSLVTVFGKLETKYPIATGSV